MQTIFSIHNLDADNFFQPTMACEQFFNEKGKPPPDKNNGPSLRKPYTNCELNRTKDKRVIYITLWLPW